MAARMIMVGLLMAALGCQQRVVRSTAYSPEQFEGVAIDPNTVNREQIGPEDPRKKNFWQRLGSGWESATQPAPPEPTKPGYQVR